MAQYTDFLHSEWVPWASTLESPSLPKSAQAEALGLGPGLILTSAEAGGRVKVAGCPPGKERAPEGRPHSREEVAGIGQKNLGGSTPLLGNKASTAPSSQPSRVKLSSH